MSMFGVFCGTSWKDPVSIECRTMKSAGRLVIAFMVFLIQSSIGMAICDCPATRNTSVLVQVKTACPMGMKTCCPCCKPFLKQTATHPSKCQTQCTIKAPSVGEPAILLAITPSMTAAILPDQTPVVASSATDAELPVPQYLAIPRVRPPNPRLHGLRAPPAR